MHLDEAPNAAMAWPAPLNRPIMKGITHMMMLGSDEGYGYDSSDIMAVILEVVGQVHQEAVEAFDCATTTTTITTTTTTTRGGRDHR